MRYTLLCLTLFVSFIHAQSSYPTDAFAPPLDIPIVLAGNFGELRSNHFHAGLDIKTEQREGLKVHASATGYISRIKIQHYGYGKAIYIQHPNGYTSVYAHLQKFAPEVEAYIKKLQYEKQSYEVEAFPKPSDLRVEQGDIIAYSGNTGGSAGPHLHFEIRDGAQKPINPLFFGFDVKDTEAPRVLGIFAFPLSEDASVNHSGNTMQLQLLDQHDGTFITQKVNATGTIGFGVNTYDRQDLAFNKNGAYTVRLTVNGTPNFGYSFNTFSFGESSYINTMIDYDRYTSKNERVQKLFLEPYNKLKIYDTNINNGLVKIEEGQFYKIMLEVSDFMGNTSTVIIPVEGKKETITDPKKEEKTEYYLLCNRDNMYATEKATVFFPDGTFYHNFYLNLKEENGVVKVHSDNLPVKNRYTLSIKDASVPETERRQTFIAHLNDNGTLSYQNTYRKGDVYSTRTKSLGSFTLAKDTTAPVVRPANFRDGQWLTNYNFLKIKISDDLSGISSYDGYIDGKWVLMEYEYKDNSLSFNFDDLHFEGTKHTLEVRVKDNVGNSTIFKADFYRK
ncbi:M23 family metallopeptidase [Robertkochia solimangrovi]|uniref:M23 family metallopeptidase n=1 Tax=Robertkochia solimangrovi TaxID=2213046 RepID=UPI00117FDE95|nr:M23 family metallopeptidase [Robertkochia solimangrovi]TRZ43816.1 M23 family peptidase [Robertkochia solimangrovi]